MHRRQLVASPNFVKGQDLSDNFKLFRDNFRHLFSEGVATHDLLYIDRPFYDFTERMIINKVNVDIPNYFQQLQRLHPNEARTLYNLMFDDHFRP